MFFCIPQLSLEKQAKLQDMLAARERALRQNKMVIKFREDNIKKLEKSLKSSNLASEDTTAIIVSTRNQIAGPNVIHYQRPMISVC